METKENIWEVINVLEKYTRSHVLSMTRPEYEAHITATRELNQVQFQRDTQDIVEKAKREQREQAEEERFQAVLHGANLAEDEEYMEKRRTESETAVDEYETARLWTSSAPRYLVNLIVDEVDKLPNVEVHLFHESMPNDEMATLVVLAPDRDIGHVAKWYSGSFIEETFSKVEVQQLHAYLKELPYFRGMKVHHASKPPDNNCMGYGAYPMGSHEGMHEFYTAEDYTLPFKVVGFWDLRERWDEYVALKEAKE